MTSYGPGDYVKVEFKDERTGYNEWMWVRVDYCDEANRLVFGWLDSEPLLDHGHGVKLGSHLAVSFDNVRDHRKSAEI